MPNNTGYINVVAVMQKFFDRAISGNWSYNPEHFPDNEVPVSVALHKTSCLHTSTVGRLYYQNTHDMKSDDVSDDMHFKELSNLVEELSQRRGGRV